MFLKRYPITTACLLIVLMAFGIPAVTTGCHRAKAITNLPPGVSENEVQNWYTATGALEVVAENDRLATASIIALNHNGKFPDGPAYNKSLETLGRIAQSGLHAKNILAAAPRTFDQNTKFALFQVYKELSTQLQQLNKEGVTGIKNPESLDQVNATIKAIDAAVQVLAQLSGASTTKLQMVEVPRG